MEVRPFDTSHFNNVNLYFSGFSSELSTTLVIICADYDLRSVKFTLFYTLFSEMYHHTVILQLAIIV